MATVRFSDDLKTDILINADNMMYPMLSAANKLRDDDKWLTAIATAIGPVLTPPFAALPRQMFPVSNDIRMSGWGTPDGVYTAYSSARISTNINLPIPQLAITGGEWEVLRTAGIIRYGATLRGVDVTLDATHPQWSALIAEISHYMAQLEAAEEKVLAFRAGVSDIMRAFATLAPALKEWPPLWDLVPERAKNRHREAPAKRKRNDPVEITTDLNTMTSVAAAAKMAK
jgi:hypothetical protein